MEMSRLTRDGTAEPVSRDQILRHARGQGNVHFPCSADHEQDWQPYPVDPYSAICDDHTYIPPGSIVFPLMTKTHVFLRISFFLFLWRCRFFRVFRTIIAVFSLYGEYVVCFFLLDSVFLPCDHGLDF